ncbi:MAG: putative transrane protein [Polyangiaceae bacterium]|nr:putative transrane protein [Polyangiaceae bacterium]
MDSSILFALGGGALIGAAASILWAFNGRIAGISGIVGGLLAPVRGDWGWRMWFVSGLLLGGLGAAVVSPERFDVSGVPALPFVALAGALVGVGTRLGNGCTSGHGVCGISRLSKRSIAATLTFMLAGAVTVFVARNLGVYS